MSTESVMIQPLLDRLRAGDASAIAGLAELTHDRLRRLVAKMLNESFPKAAARHDVDSVLNTTYVRLHDALAKMAAQATSPPTPADFFRFAAFKVRQVLLDTAGQDRRVGAGRLELPGGNESGWLPPPELIDGGPGPQKLAQWREMLAQLERLPQLERDVFEMHFLMGMTQAETAEALGEEPKRVSRAWLKAAAALAQSMPES